MAQGRWWKFYFFFTVFMTVCSFAAAFWGKDEISMPWWEWISFPIYVLQAVALFGIVFSRRIATSAVWKILFVVTVGYELWDVYDMATHWAPSASSTAITVVLAMTYLMQIPLWYGNFLYGFRCQKLWNAKA